MTYERSFKGVWIPADVWLNKDLSLTEKVMLVEIGSLETPDRGCYASNSYFAEFFDLSKSRVSEIISGLAAKGLIEVEQVREGRRIIERRIRIATVFGKPKGYSENASNPIRKTEEGYSEKAKENNTSINNTKEHINTAPEDAGSSDQLAHAFDTFWKAGLSKIDKQRAYKSFVKQMKDAKAKPDEFAAMLVDDIKARIAAKQYGIDRLHPTTYLNNQRWESDIIPGDPKPRGSRTAAFTDFSKNTYVGTPEDEIGWL